MRILLFGKNGQVGWELQRSLAPMGKLEAHDSTSANFKDQEKIVYIVNNFKPDIVVNAAAYTAVDRAEEEREDAYLINGKIPGVLGSLATKMGVWLIHYSTDYVFDGKKGPRAYIEKDVTTPINTYGHSKLMGEKAIQDVSDKYLIFRTSWVFSSRGNNFVKTILRLAHRKKQLRVVCDQSARPTSAELIADMTALAVNKIMTGDLSPVQSGIYHLASSKETSWYGLAKTVLDEAQKIDIELGVKSKDIVPVLSEEYPLQALRPENTGLNSRKLAKLLKVEMPHWKPYVRRAVQELATGDGFR